MILVAISKRIGSVLHQIALVEYYGVKLLLSADGQYRFNQRERLGVYFVHGEEAVPKAVVGRIAEEMQNMGKVHDRRAEYAWEALNV